MTPQTLQALGATLLIDVQHYGYFALAAGVLLENAGVPVPGETMLLAAAGLAARGKLSIVLVAAVATAAAVAGDNIGFAIGRLGGRPALVSFGRWVFVTPERLDRMDRFFRRRGPVAVFLARFVPAFRVVGALVAGASAMHWRTFLVFNALGACTWATAVSIIGYSGEGLVTTALPWLRTVHLGAWLLLVATAIALAGHVVFEALHTRRMRTATKARRRRRLGKRKADPGGTR